MRNIKFLMLLFGFFVFIVLPFKAEAIECSIEQINRFKKWANNVELKYSYMEEGLEYLNEDEEIEVARNMFSITANNLIPGLILMDETHFNIFAYDSSLPNSSSIAHEGYRGGEKYSFAFYINMPGPCHEKLIMKKTIEIPKYNFYSENDLCKGVEEFQLCQKWYQGNIPSLDYFVDAVNEYKKSLSDNDVVTTNNTIWEQVTNFLIKYYNYILSVIIVLGTGGIIVLKIRERKRGVL